jgi:ribose 5-phosphate isomerase B
MNLIIGADHAGYEMKEYIKKQLKDMDIKDVSEKVKEGDDYPDHVKRLVKELKKDKKAKGILVCGTGVGVCIAANRFRGIRAALLFNEHITKKARTSNDANVACFSGWNFSKEKAVKLAKLFLKTQFDNKKRRQRRIKKLDKL